jgi:hypothetical protein
MADNPQDREAELEALFESAKSKYGEDALKRFFKKTRKKKGPKGRRGRPRIDDEAALSAMADLLHLNSVDSERQAAVAVVVGVEGASLGAKIHRLCKKFRECREQLKAEAAKRHKPRICFAVEALTGPPRDISELRAQAQRRTPRDISELRAEYQRLGIFDMAATIDAAKRHYEDIFGKDFAGSALLEMERTHARDFERARQAIMEQLRVDQETLRSLALGENWKRFIGGG